MFEYVISVLNDDVNYWEIRVKDNGMVAKKHLDELNQAITLLEKAEDLTKENAELKQVIAHSDGVQMQNEDLIRENDRLKKLLDISKDRIKELAENVLFKQHCIKNNEQNRFATYSTCKGILRDCAEQIANEIMGKL